MLLGSLLGTIVASAVESWVVKETTSKEHSEDVIGIEIIILFMEPLVVLLSEVIFTSMLIVELSLFWIAQTRKRLTNFFERISSLRCLILIRMEFESQFPVCFLNLIFISIFRHIEYFIVVLLT